MNKIIPVVTFAIGFVAGALATRALVRKSLNLNITDNAFRDFDCDEWRFESAEDAQVVVERLCEIAEKRGYATMADLCRLTDTKTVPMSASYGWIDLDESDFSIVAENDEWVMKLPPLENVRDVPNHKDDVTGEGSGDAMAEYTELTRYYDTESEEKPMKKERHKPYVISPEDYMSREDDGYKAETYYLYEDGIITDDGDNIVDDVPEVFGMPFSEICRHFGEYDDNSVYFRDVQLATDYEILRTGSEFRILEVT